MGPLVVMEPFCNQTTATLLSHQAKAAWGQMVAVHNKMALLAMVPASSSWELLSTPVGLVSEMIWHWMEARKEERQKMVAG